MVNRVYHLIDSGNDGSFRGYLEQLDCAVDELMEIRTQCSPTRAIAILCAVRRINEAKSGIENLLEVEVPEDSE